MKKIVAMLCMIPLFFYCTERKEKTQITSAENINTESKISPDPNFGLAEANKLIELPLHCAETEYPNKLGQTIGGDEDLLPPRELHPVFYGCFDWHSAVHGYWSMVTLLRNFPKMDKSDRVRTILKTNITKENVAREVAYFEGKHSKSYERTYGWAWLLKLAEVLYNWDDPLGLELSSNLQPLTDVIVAKYLEFLPKLVYPIRVGEHTNTAFGLTFAYDYAKAVNHNELMKLIENRALDFYLNDRSCPIDWEPSGFDFLSPCLEEIDIMRRVLPANDFKEWLNGFMPQLVEPIFSLATGEVSDRTDGKLVHLDGLNFSRAWVLYGLANQYPELGHLKNIANEHVAYSYLNLVGDSYEGGHWLGSFAIYALETFSDK
ncbi:MAG: DUF2891 domain-containing protein [Bacteroidetes bacterium]|nr:MAG: DUF2891 domain-containing protein [Bacteroidota bacterium]